MKDKLENFKEEILEAYRKKSEKDIRIKYNFEQGYIFAGSYCRLYVDEVPYFSGGEIQLNLIDVHGKYLQNIVTMPKSFTSFKAWGVGNQNSNKIEIEDGKRFYVAFMNAESSDECILDIIKEENDRNYNSLLCKGKRGKDLITYFIQEGNSIFLPELTDKQFRNLIKTLAPEGKNFHADQYEVFHNTFLEQLECGNIDQEFMKKYLTSSAAVDLFQGHVLGKLGDSSKRNKNNDDKLRKIVLDFCKDNKDMAEVQRFLTSTYKGSPQENFFKYLITGDSVGFYKLMEEQSIERINADKINAGNKHFNSRRFIKDNLHFLENNERNKNLIKHLRKNDIIEYVVKDIRLGGKEYGDDPKLNIKTYQDVKRLEKEQRVKAFGKDLSEEWLLAENKTAEFAIIKKAIVNSEDKDECIKNIYPYFSSNLHGNDATDIDMYLFMHKESVDKEKFFETIFETFYFGDYTQCLKENENILLKTKGFFNDLVNSSAYACVKQSYLDKYLPLYAAASKNNDVTAKINNLKKNVQNSIDAPDNIDAMSAKERKELFNLSKKAIEDTPKLKEVAISNMMNVYVATEDREEQKTYLLDLYILRKSGKTDKEKREMAKTFNRVITRDERLHKNTHLANLAKVDTVISQPSRSVKKVIESR